MAVAGKTFLTIKCPACGSGEVEARDGGHFECGHCGTKFAPNKAQGGRGVGATGGPNSGCVVVVVAVVIIAAISVAGFVLFLPMSAPAVRGPSAPASVVQEREALPPPPPAQATPTPEPAVAEERPVPTPVEPPVPIEERPVVVDEPAGPSRTLREATAAGVVMEAFQPLQGCSCKADLDGDGKSETLKLATKGSTIGTTISSGGTFHTYGLEFVVRGSDDGALYFDPAITDAPPSRLAGDWLDLGVGCTDDNVIIAAGTQVTSWSLRELKVAWTSELAAPYTKKPTARSNNGLVIDCGKLPIKSDKVEIRLPGGNVKLELATGNKVDK